MLAIIYDMLAFIYDIISSYIFSYNVDIHAMKKVLINLLFLKMNILLD